MHGQLRDVGLRGGEVSDEEKDLSSMQREISTCGGDRQLSFMCSDSFERLLLPTKIGQHVSLTVSISNCG